MTVKEYEDFMSTSKVYNKLPIVYPILGMNGEAGEVAEKAKKWLANGAQPTEVVGKLFKLAGIEK